MSGNVGIPISLFIFVGLLAFAISYEGWDCGRLIDDKCRTLSTKYSVILWVICAAGILALLGAILYSVYISNESNGLRIAGIVFAVVAACCAIAVILYYYIDTPTISSKSWGHLITMFASGLGLGVILSLLGTLCEDIL
ncbi:unnamed protein product [Rodentolepis nana]|uniref:MARVEL domain-containing protein n=1 Tax=Rodentolepis nana TaxID=102285 RepID=A0A0R3T9L5_RODNA|nr:unnamed protein product [Rodentolepis nana]